MVIKLGVITITNKRGPGQRLGNIPKEEKASIEWCEYASWDSQRSVFKGEVASLLGKPWGAGIR